MKHLVFMLLLACAVIYSVEAFALDDHLLAAVGGAFTGAALTAPIWLWRE